MNQNTMRNKKGKGRKGQFFSLDAVAGTAIFLIAVFLIAFYWMNTQARMSEQGVDLQRDAERIADQLLTQSKLAFIVATDASPPNQENIIIYHLSHDEFPQLEAMMPVASLGTGNGTIYAPAMALFQALSSTDDMKSYRRMKNRLGIPQYEFYVELAEDAPNRDPSPFCVHYSIPPDAARANVQCITGFTPQPGARQVALAERMVLYKPCISAAYNNSQPGDGQINQPCEFRNAHHLARLRVYVWR